jgi:hypothetical protein
MISLSVMECALCLPTTDLDSKGAINFSRSLASLAAFFAAFSAILTSILDLPAFPLCEESFSARAR